MAEKSKKKAGKPKSGSTRSKPVKRKTEKVKTKPKSRVDKQKKSRMKSKSGIGKPKKSKVKPKSSTVRKSQAGGLKPKVVKGGHSKKDLKLFEQRLLEERDKILKQLGIFGMTYMNTMKDSSGDLSSYSFHMADMGTDAMEREKAFLFASQEGRLLYHIDEALRRLYKGEKYGICQLCSRKIQKKRLNALPHARLCIECKSKEESGA